LRLKVSVYTLTQSFTWLVIIISNVFNFGDAYPVRAIVVWLAQVRKRKRAQVYLCHGGLRRQENKAMVGNGYWVLGIGYWVLGIGVIR
jgi:hypothetical protein